MHLLRRGAFAGLVAGSAFNAIGSWAALIALWGFAAVHFGVGANGIALIGLAWSLPAAVLSPLAGIPVDRFGPKTVLVAANVLGVGAALALVAATTFHQLLALALVVGLVNTLGKPAALALPARLVDDADLLRANSLLGGAEQSAIIFGPLVGALAISLGGIGAAFAFDAATFAVGALAVLPVRLRPVPGSGSPGSGSPGTTAASVLGELVVGLRLARRIGDVRRTLALAAAAFGSWGAFFVLEPLYVRDVLHRSPAVLGLLQSFFGVGLLGMTVLLPRLGDRVGSVRVVAVSVAASGVVAALYVGTRSLPVAIVGVFLWGVDVAFFLPPMQTILQRATPTEAHGRVLALSSQVSALGDVVAIPFAGVAVAAIGVRQTGAVVGGLAVLAGVVGVVVTRRPASAGAPPGAAAPTLPHSPAPTPPVAGPVAVSVTDLTPGGGVRAR